MAWSGEILQTWQQGPLFKSLVSLNDGSANYVERFAHSGTSSSLRRVVREWIDARESRVTVVLSSGAIDCSPFPSNQIPPTQEEMNRAEFSRVWVRHKQLKNAVAEGLIASDATVVQRSASSVSALWQPSYVDLCRTI